MINAKVKCVLSYDRQVSQAALLVFETLRVSLWNNTS